MSAPRLFGAAAEWKAARAVIFGSGPAATAIRAASAKLGTLDSRNGVDLATLKIHDAGAHAPDTLARAAAKFPLQLGDGGAVADALAKRHKDLATLALAARPVVGAALTLGAREDTAPGRAPVVTSHEVARHGMGAALHDAHARLDTRPMLLHLDLNALDPAHGAFADGAPFGLAPADVLQAIQRLAPRTVGARVVGATEPRGAMLGAAFARAILTEVSRR